MTANAHLDAFTGQLTLSQLERMYHKQEGFTVLFDGVSDACKTLTIAWSHVVNHADKLLIFGPPIDFVRNYSRVFRRLSAESQVKNVFRHFAAETLGDVFSSSSLSLAYKDKMLLLKEQRLVKESEKDELLTFNETEKSQIFFDVFDKLCEHSLIRASCGFNDYNLPIIPLATFDDFVNLAEYTLPRMWRHFCSLRGARSSRSADRHKERRDLTMHKKRSVFIQILLHKRTRNPRQLKWFAALMAIGFYGWGVGRTPLGVISQFGVTCSSRTRDRCLSVLCDDIVMRQIRLFSALPAVSFVIDNYGETVPLRFMRSQRTAIRMSGTHEMAHAVTEYNDTH